MIIVSLLCLPLAAVAQTDEALDPEFGGRIALGVDKKIVKGLHITLEEELRLDDNFSALNRMQTTVGIRYKILPFLKVGLGYALINKYDDSLSSFKSPRHRVFVDVTGTYRAGDWQFSLKERLQMTHRTGSFNEYQNPANLWALKSRLKVTYKGLDRLEPFAAVELRNTLNAPVISAVYNEATDSWGYYNSSNVFTEKGESGWFLEGFKGVYINRLRFTLGADYSFNKHHSIEVSLMGDYCMDKVVDASGKGKYLHSYTRETGIVGWLCASYNYSF